jgi:hypothetical protein
MHFASDRISDRSATGRMILLEPGDIDQPTPTCAPPPGNSLTLYGYADNRRSKGSIAYIS